MSRRPSRHGRIRRALRALALGTSLGAALASLARRRLAKDAAEVRPVRTPEWPPLTGGDAPT